MLQLILSAKLCNKMIDNPGAINGIKQLLINCSDNEVLSLCATITQGLLKNKINSRDGKIINQIYINR